MARLYNFLLPFYLLLKKEKPAWHAMTNSNSWAQNTTLHKQRNGRWRYLLKAGGLWAQRNLSWTWSNREPQTMPIIIAAFYPAVTFIHHPQPEESCKISPLSERLMATLAPFFLYIRLLASVLWTPTMQLQSPLVHLLFCCGCCEPQSFLLFCQVARAMVKWRDVSYLQFPG